MPTAEFEVHSDVRVRDNTGRFISAVKSGLADALAEIAEDGETMARELAPTGHKPDRRTPPIQASFYHYATPTKAVWGNKARHALAQELGAVPHPITGQVKFFWEREGRWWHPGKNLINHPGNPARPYLRPSFLMVTGRYEEYLKRHMKALV